MTLASTATIDAERATAYRELDKLNKNAISEEQDEHIRKGRSTLHMLLVAIDRFSSNYANGDWTMVRLWGEDIVESPLFDMLDEVQQQSIQRRYWLARSRAAE